MKTIANKTKGSIAMRGHCLDKNKIISPNCNSELKEMIEKFPNCKGMYNNGKEFILEINKEHIKTVRPHGQGYDVRTYNLNKQTNHLDCEQKTIANYHPIYNSIETKTGFFNFN
jgi:hypothetical protein